MGELPAKLVEEIRQYCEFNKITDIDSFMVLLLRTGFTVIKYGEKPTSVTSVSNERKKNDNVEGVEPVVSEPHKPRLVNIKNNEEDIYGED